MAKQSKLTVANLRKEDKKLFGGTRKVVIDGFTLEIDSIFRDTKIEQMVYELINAGDKFRKNGAKLETILSPYAILLTMKYFTSLDIPNDLDGQMEVMNLLLDLKLFDKIVNEMPEDEMYKIGQRIVDLGQSALDTLDEFEREAAKLDIENEEVARLLLNKGDKNADI